MADRPVYQQLIFWDEPRPIVSINTERLIRSRKQDRRFLAGLTDFRSAPEVQRQHMVSYYWHVLLKAAAAGTQSPTAAK